jgi:competence protein ComEA
MLKKLLLAAATFIATMGFAFAQIDVNKADQAALDGVKGIGPKTSKAILDERKKGGDFKDWADFEKRVKGIGGKSSSKLSEAGLSVNGQPKPNAVGSAALAKEGKKASASASAKAEPKKDDMKDVKKDKKSDKTASAPVASASASASAKKP